MSRSLGRPTNRSRARKSNTVGWIWSRLDGDRPITSDEIYRSNYLRERGNMRKEDRSTIERLMAMFVRAGVAESTRRGVITPVESIQPPRNLGELYARRWLFKIGGMQTGYEKWARSRDLAARGMTEERS